MTTEKKPVDEKLQALYKEMNWERFEVDINGKPKEFLAMRVSDNPNDKNCMKTDMHLICFWCNEFFNPYDEMITNEMKGGVGMAWGDFCCDRCARLYFKYGKLLEFLRDIKRYLIYKPIYAIKEEFWSEFCPNCQKKEDKLVMMRTMLSGELYMCDRCWNNFEIHRDKIRHPVIRQYIQKTKRLLYYIENGGKSKVITIGEDREQVPTALPILDGDGEESR